MFSAKHLIIVALLSAIFNLHFEALAECDTPCQPLTSPSGYPAYVAPPLPSLPPPSPPLSGYSIYSSPPPPHKSSQSKCPPAPGATYAPPYGTYYGPPTPYYGPPSPYYTFGPPNVYTPVPYGQGTRSAAQILPILTPVVMLYFSFIFPF